MTQQTRGTVDMTLSSSALPLRPTGHSGRPGPASPAENNASSFTGVCAEGNGDSLSVHSSPLTSPRMDETRPPAGGFSNHGEVSTAAALAPHAWSPHARPARPATAFASRSPSPSAAPEEGGAVRWVLGDQLEDGQQAFPAASLMRPTPTDSHGGPHMKAGLSEPDQLRSDSGGGAGGSWSFDLHRPHTAPTSMLSVKVVARDGYGAASSLSFAPAGTGALDSWSAGQGNDAPGNLTPRVFGEPRTSSGKLPVETESPRSHGSHGSHVTTSGGIHAALVDTNSLSAPSTPLVYPTNSSAGGLIPSSLQWSRLPEGCGRPRSSAGRSKVGLAPASTFWEGWH